MGILDYVLGVILKETGVASEMSSKAKSKISDMEREIRQAERNGADSAKIEEAKRKLEMNKQQLRKFDSATNRTQKKIDSYKKRR